MTLNDLEGLIELKV